MIPMVIQGNDARRHSVGLTASGPGAAVQYPVGGEKKSVGSR